MCFCHLKELEKQAEQELLALQKQKEMLTQLLEKQKQVEILRLCVVRVSEPLDFQIQELEAKQMSLLEMKKKAELELKEAEEKVSLWSQDPGVT